LVSTLAGLFVSSLISEGEGSTQNPHKNDGKQNLQFLKHHQIIDTNIDAKG